MKYYKIPKGSYVTYWEAEWAGDTSCADPLTPISAGRTHGDIIIPFWNREFELRKVLPYGQFGGPDEYHFVLDHDSTYNRISANKEDVEVVTNDDV